MDKSASVMPKGMIRRRGAGMTRISNRLIAVWMLLVLLLPAAGYADDVKIHQSGKFSYILLDDGTAEIVDYAGSKKRLEIPSKLKGKEVTGIGRSAFYWNKSLETVILPGTLTHIGGEAFKNCDKLTGITIPDSVSSIDANPFENCERFETITVSPDHPYLVVTGGVLFSRDDRRLICYPNAFTAESYTVPDGTMSIGDHAFCCCRLLKEIVLPDSVSIIGEGAFSLCNSLAVLTLPDGVTAIGKEAFSFCFDLTEIRIPSGVTFIGEKAFHGCDQLTVLVEAGSYAEQYCRENDIRYSVADGF